jgi:hypothetical protein
LPNAKARATLKLTIYKPFNLQNPVSQKDFFNLQMEIIRQSYTNITILLGDLNLDTNKKGSTVTHFIATLTAWIRP